jgi:hypothetical protein
MLFGGLSGSIVLIVAANLLEWRLDYTELWTCIGCPPPRAPPLPFSPCPAPCRVPGPSSQGLGRGRSERGCAATGRQERTAGDRERDEKEVNRDTGDGLPCGRVAGLDEHERLGRILPQLVARGVRAV